MNIATRFFPVLVLIITIAILTGCEGEQPQQPPPSSLPGTKHTQQKNSPPTYGDVIVEGSIADAINLIPILASDTASHNISNLIFNGLVKYDKNLNIVGDLAESWEIAEKGTVITFHLRKGVRWHDGQPFTVQDVLFTYRLTVDPATPTAYAGDFLKVKKAEALDDYTFQVTYDKPFAPALSSWGSAVLPRHLLEGTDITRTSLARHPIGTGPFIFKEWQAGQKIVLTSNPHYFEGRPYLDGYIVRIIPDTATMFLELRAKGIDQMGLTPLQYQRQTDTPVFHKNFKKYRYPAFAYTYLGYNLKSPFFQDKLVRQALTCAINKEEIVASILLNLGQAATGPFKPGTWAYNPNVRRYTYNPEKAKELLMSAGWKDTDGDGIVDRGGQPFAFEIITNQGNEVRARCAEIVQQRLAAIGISVKIRIIEWAAFINDFINKGKFDATILGWTITLDPDLYDVWHSSKTKPGELNFISYKNEEVDELLEAGRSTFDISERKRCYDRIQEILAEEQPYTFLYVPDALPIISSRFEGIEPAPIGIGHNLIRWHVPSDRQRYVME